MTDFPDMQSALNHISKELASLRADALAARITAGVAVERLALVSDHPEEAFSELRNRALGATSNTKVGRGNYELNAVMLETATEHISALFASIAKVHGWRIEPDG
jgi:hypothetical protein